MTNKELKDYIRKVIKEELEKMTLILRKKDTK